MINSNRSQRYLEASTEVLEMAFRMGLGILLISIAAGIYDHWIWCFSALLLSYALVLRWRWYKIYDT